MDFVKLVELINKVLGANGLSLPPNVEEGTLIQTLETIAATLEHMKPKAPDAAPPDGAPPELPKDGAAMGSVLQGLLQSVKDLSSAVQAIKTDTVKGKYDEELLKLATSGNITAAVQQQWLNLGPTIGYNLSALNPLKSLKMVDLSNRSRSQQSSAPPTPAKHADGTESSDLTPEQIAEGAAALGGARVVKK